MDALEQRIHNLETTVQEQSESLKELESTGDRNVVQLQEEIGKLQNIHHEVGENILQNYKKSFWLHFTKSIGSQKKLK